MKAGCAASYAQLLGDITEAVFISMGEFNGLKQWTLMDLIYYICVVIL
jgi:hypothetical protein